MTEAINKYMELKNSPIEESDIEETKMFCMNALLETARCRAEVRWVTRYIADTRIEKRVIYETGYSDAKEKAFVLTELQKKFKNARVFCVDEQVWELKDGLE